MKKVTLGMGKALKFLSLFMVALLLVFGAGGEVDAKKKKKKLKLTDEENAMFDRWNVKPKNERKQSKISVKNQNLLGLLNVMVVVMIPIIRLGQNPLMEILITS